jgi:hypothetical protein
LENSARPIVAWIANSLPPYRLYSFRRIVNEIPEIEFWSLFTHGPGKSSANLPWKQEYPAEGCLKDGGGRSSHSSTSLLAMYGCAAGTSRC